MWLRLETRSASIFVNLDLFVDDLFKNMVGSVFRTCKKERNSETNKHFEPKKNQ